MSSIIFRYPKEGDSIISFYLGEVDMSKSDVLFITLTVVSIAFVMITTHKAFTNLEIILTHYLGGK